MQNKEAFKNAVNRLESSSSLAPTFNLLPLEVDFKTGLSERLKKGQLSLEVTANKVDKALNTFNRMSYNNNVVYVHCAMGVSRSASCVIMYIMKKYKVLFEDVRLNIMNFYRR
jgi:Dual specificity phosphatase, catalytic domain